MLAESCIESRSQSRTESTRDGAHTNPGTDAINGLATDIGCIVGRDGEFCGRDSDSEFE